MSVTEYYLEVGPKKKPILDNLKNEYVGVGKKLLLDKKNWRQGEQNIEPYFSQADAENMPYPDNTFSTVVEKEVFCAEGEWDEDPKGRTVKESVGDVVLIAKEFYRVTKPDGKVILIETLTPTPELISSLKNAFIGAGFKLDEEWKGSGIMNLFSSKPEAWMTLLTKDATALVFKK